MFFTQEDYKKIQQWLVKNSVKDTEFNEAIIPFNGNEIVSIVQGSQNKKVFLKDLVSQIFNLGVSDFINITDKYEASYITLEEAIRYIPSKARKVGQVITFLNEEGHWHIYQFRGVLNQWNTLDKWEDLFDWEKLISNSILPDEEDLTKSLPDENGNSYLSLKDRKYEPEKYSGLGRIILRKNIIEIEDPIYGKVKKNILTQDMINKSNTIYEIRYDFDLNGKEITIPEGCVLDFQGGSFSNGTIVGNNTRIKSDKNMIFIRIIIKGVWAIESVYSSWFDFEDYEDSINTTNLRNLSALTNENFINNIFIDDIYITVNVNDGYCMELKSHTNLFISGTIALKSTNRSIYKIIVATDVDDIHIIGHGTIIGDIETHIGEEGQWGHCIHFLGVTNSSIKNITLKDAWGDGISVDSSESRRSGNILIENVNSSRNRRQGISIEGAHDVYVLNCNTSYIGTYRGNNPKAGIDVEPWREGEFAENVYIENFKDIGSDLSFTTGASIKDIHLKNCDFGSTVALFGNNDNCTINNCIFREYVLIQRGNVEFTNCNIPVIVFNDVNKVNFVSCNIGQNLINDNAINYYGGLINATFDDITPCEIIFDSCDFFIGTPQIKAAFSWMQSNEYKSIIIKKSTINLINGDFTVTAFDIYDSVFNGYNINFNHRKRNSTLHFCRNKINTTKTSSFAYFGAINGNETFWDISSNDFTNAASITPSIDSSIDFSNKSIIFANNIFNHLSEYGGHNFKTLKDMFTKRFKSVKFSVILPQIESNEGSVRPTLYANNKGYLFFDTTLNKPIWWTGKKWVDATGANV